MDVETGIYRNQRDESLRTILTLAYQSLGVVYGDLSTSPLYVFKSTFDEDIIHSQTNEEIYGVLSLIFWTLTLVPLLKYILIVLRADDSGEGGTFALYSLLCRHAKVYPLPSGQLADEDLTSYKNRMENLKPSSFAAKLKSILEKYVLLQKILLVLALLGACMMIGDGILTPAISVFAAVSSVELALDREHNHYIEAPVACAILIALFVLQHYGSRKVGFLFAPVVLTWLLCISSIGVYNIFRWNPHVYRALSPFYLYIYLKKTKSDGWKSLGGIILCIAGSEAMYADLGHFTYSSIKIAFTTIVYPSLIFAYMGQAAYLSQNHDIYKSYIGFFASVPVQLRWPVIVIAILAAVVGSQAMITGTFSIVKQCSAMGCFPRVKIVHTSSKIHGQIYIPEINWTLMLLCLSVTIGFRDIGRLGNAAGLAIIAGMMVTTCFMFLVIILCWHQNIAVAMAFLCFFGTIEVLFFTASLVKFLQGAWVPIVLSFILMIVMYVWHYGTVKMYEFEVQNKVSVDWLLELGTGLGLVRLPGIGIIHTELVSGIPAIFCHFITNLPAFHQIVIFVCIKSVPVPSVQPEERFLIGRIGPREYGLYRCIVRYGYRDAHMDDLRFENDLICSIAEFVRTGKPGLSINGYEDNEMVVIGTSSAQLDGIQLLEGDGEISETVATAEVQPIKVKPRKRVRFVIPERPGLSDRTAEELRRLMEAREAGVTHILGRSYVRAKANSGLVREAVVNYAYDFMRRNCRDPACALTLPQPSTLQVGMVYRI